MPRLVSVLVVGLSAAIATAQPPAKIEFDRDIRPLFVRSCYSCHGPDKQRGGLRLDQKSAALAGGDSGKVIAANGKDSLLVKLVSGHDPDRQMPPKGDKLTAAEIALLSAWIDRGADWPGVEETKTWWSLVPPTRPAVPKVAGVTNPIDAFIRVKLAEKGLTPSPRADRRTLVRRLYFDLIGLPPTPAEIDAFVKDDSPNAYEKLVEHLLASPHYGERWARHWLDVVHYGDTHGYDKDQPRPNAWPYRDYVIRALNADRPYSQFVREQLAGDVLYPGTVDGVTATGFLSAGPWDFIGHVEVPETKIDGKIARHLDRDDMVGTAMNTFVGLTVQCAQCHNHKFDPIRQEDYYRLQAVFAAIDRSDRPYHTDPAAEKTHRELTARKVELSATKKRLDDAVKKVAGPKLTELDKRITAADKPGTMRAEFGYHSGLSAKPDVTKWVQVDLGKSVRLSRVVLFGCHDDFNNIGAGFGFPVRFKVEASDDPTFATVTTIADRTTADVPNPGITPRPFAAETKARFLRVTATKLAARQNDYNFALAEIKAFDDAGVNVASGATVTALDSIEAPVRWRKSNLTDGYAPGRGRDDVSSLKAERLKLLKDSTDTATATALAEADRELGVVEGGLAKVKPAGTVYAGTIHNGGGAAFRGTGPDGGKPRPIHVLRRGDVKSPAAEVGPGSLTIGELKGTFDLPPTHREGDRRVALAEWVAEPRNPLTWRVIVNRVWQYHFGRGIVATPNDFGKMGQLPTHPELLDWLAVEFRDGGQSLKKLHKLIVTSATYQQVSTGNPANEKLDTGNAYLWRMTRRKLEAEAVRDAALAVAGKLDRTMYGPAFQDFVVKHPEHSPHYEYHLFDPANSSAYRRSVYRFLVRSKPQPFMTVLDCADPSMQVDKRTETLSPLQALALFNNAFMLTMAKELAARVETEPDPVSAAVRLAIGREPTATEAKELREYAKEHGLANACRVVLNLNEFVFVD